MHANNDPKQVNHRNVIFLLFLIHLTFTLGFGLFSIENESLIPGESLTYPLSWILVLLAIWCLWSWRVARASLFDPYTIFFLAAVLFNGGHAFLEIFRLNRAGFLDNIFSEETEYLTLRLVILGIAAMHLGALAKALFSHEGHAARTSLDQGEHSAISVLASMRMVGWFLLIISFIPSIIVFSNSVEFVLNEGYSGLYQQEASVGLNSAPHILSNFLAPSAILLLLGGYKMRHIIILSWCIVISFSVIQFFLGYRSDAVMPLVAMLWAYHRSVRKVPRAVLLALGSLILFIVLPLVRVIRNVTGDERLSFSFLWQSYLSIDNPVIGIISEIGGSMKTVAYTLALVPLMKDFEYGMGYIYASTSLVPNLFWDVHPAIEHGYASKWLIESVDPATAARGGGLGFSFIAEAYLNFGTLGAPIFLFLLGLVLASMSLWVSHRGDPTRVALIACLLCFLPVYARGEAFSIIRPLVWYAFIPFAIVRVLSGLTTGLKHSTANSTGLRHPRRALRQEE